ncbi:MULTISPECIES: hypothetical protein [unclassified Clostridium]|uniref:hypothetical protein n=1 Tax=unclassified Clostridium TaxID=2614128 RepID=UPI000297A26C|nr:MULTISPECIES: hypothetical protein [unclassified Clostridium]EKQ57553.1 MAG: hypothetical protein A370_00806 [Clostridium sp. Maddingley MBC34-26]
MNEMYFKNILISDIQARTARFQEFSKGFNVITSQDNHVGKSSLLKSLYYTLGTEVDYDSVWDKRTKLYIVTICVNGIDYKIARFQKSFAVFKEEELVLLTRSVTHDLAKKYEELFSFAVYLPNKDTKKIEMAPPAFSFMPYYIDQDKGWSGLYNSFASIDQYKQNDRIKSLYYHLNIYTKYTVELMAKRDQIKDEIEKLKKEEERIRITLEALSQETQNLLPAETLEDLERNLQIPKEQIATLVKKAGEVRNKIQSLEITLNQHEHQLQVIKEYRNIKIDVGKTDQKGLYTCPQCGYTFDEEIYEIVRSNYNIQNEDYMCQQVQLIIDSIVEELDRHKNQYVELMADLEELEKVFDESQDAYKVYVRQRGLKDSLTHFSQQLSYNSLKQSEYADKIKKIAKELRKLPNKREVEEKYIEYVRLNIISLDAWNAAYEGNIKLLKPMKAQGTLENKIILAQFVGLFQTMEYFKSSAIRFPFVIDSPRAKEASNSSSKDILKLISEVDMLPQVILATMDYSDFGFEISHQARITILTEKRKLLNKENYESHKHFINQLLELFKNL